MSREDFAIFILSHGRPNNVRTINTLERCGYTGKWFLLCDNEDETIEEYYSKFGKDKVIVFDKKYAESITDKMDNIDKRNSIVFARNICYELATKMNLKYFLQFEDDYRQIHYRYEENNKLKAVFLKHFDDIVDNVIEYMTKGNIDILAFGQAGDFIGGAKSQLYKSKMKRKVMNSLFCKVDRPVKFFGRMNDDVNAYTYYGSLGYVFLTICDIRCCTIRNPNK